MNTYLVEESAVIAAPAARIYALLADYQQGHPSILPARYFKECTVLKGGQGAGTEVAVKMEVYGATVAYRMTVSEPASGRVLSEEDVQAGVVTTFTVEPMGDAQARVTIATVTTAQPGLRGWVEKMTAPGIMRRIYRTELAQIAEVVDK